MGTNTCCGVVENSGGNGRGRGCDNAPAAPQRNGVVGGNYRSVGGCEPCEASCLLLALRFGCLWIGFRDLSVVGWLLVGYILTRRSCFVLSLSRGTGASISKQALRFSGKYHKPYREIELVCKSSIFSIREEQSRYWLRRYNRCIQQKPHERCHADQNEVHSTNLTNCRKRKTHVPKRALRAVSTKRTHISLRQGWRLYFGLHFQFPGGDDVILARRPGRQLATGDPPRSRTLPCTCPAFRKGL